MTTYALVLDYGTHTRVDSFHDSLQKAEWERVNLLNEYRKKGFTAEHKLDGEVRLVKQIGSRLASPYGSDESVPIPVHERIWLRIEQRR